MSADRRLRFIARGFVAGFVLTAFGAACGGEADDAAGPSNLPEVSASPSLGLDTETLSYISEVYPEFIQVRGSGTVLLDEKSRFSDIPAKVVNFSRLDFNPDFIRGVYEYYEALALLGIEGKFMYPYKIRGKDRILIMGPSPLITSRMTLFIPDESPPLPVPGTVDSRPAVTAVDLDSGQAITFIQEKDYGFGIFRSKEQSLTGNFMIEMCHQVIMAAPLDSSGQVVLDGDEIIFTQELVCNSFGMAAAAKALNVPFEDYDKFIRGRTMSFGPGYRPSDGEYPMIPLDRESYASIQFPGSLIKNF